MTCMSLELFQMGGGVLSSLTPFLHEHSWAVLFGILPHWSELLQRRDSTGILFEHARPHSGPGCPGSDTAGDV